MRVLGIDPGLTRCGWGVVDGRPGARPTALGVGVIRTLAELDLELRLLELHTAVTALLREHRPDVVAVERVFTQNNKGTAIGTAQAAGVAALAAAQADRPVAWHTPSEVKAAISGNGRADKEQVTTMVTRVLGLAEAPQAGRRGRRPRARRLPRLARSGAAAAAGRGHRRRHRGAGALDDAAAVDGGGGPMIASVSGRVAAVVAGRRRGGGRRHRAGRAVHPGHDRAAPGGGERPAVDQPDRARGLADPLRLRRRRRAQPVRAAADRQRRRARGWRRRCWRSTRRARSAAPCRWPTSRR